MADIDRGLVELANSMLDQLHIPTQINSIEDCSSVIFALIYEGLCGEHIPDLVRRPRSHQDEIHNCQLVIDALSMDILHTSLSHITGEDLAMADRIAVSNVLEIFSGLMEYILNKIESDVSSTDGECVEDLDDPDHVSPHLIDDILERELSRDHYNRENKPAVALGVSQKDNVEIDQSRVSQAPASWNPLPGRLESTESLIKEGELLDRGSESTRGSRLDMGRQTGSRLDMGRQTGSRLDLGSHTGRLPSSLPQRDSSNNIHRQNEHFQTTAQSLTPELSPPVRPAATQFDNVGQRIHTAQDTDRQRKPESSSEPDTKSRLTHTHHLYHHYGQPTHHTAPQVSLRDDQMPAHRLTSTDHQSSHRLLSQTAQQQHNVNVPIETGPPARRSTSYDKLQAEVDRTVQLARDALGSHRGRAERVELDEKENILSSNIHERLNRIQSESTEIHQLAKSLNLPERLCSTSTNTKPLSRSVGVPSQVTQRKVSFATQKANEKDQLWDDDLRQRETILKTSLRRFYEERSDRSSVSQPVEVTSPGHDYLSDSSPEVQSSPDTSPVRRRQRRLRGLLLKDLANKTGRKVIGKPPTKAGPSRRAKVVDHLAEAHKHVNTEDVKARRKAEFLRLLYEHELEDLKDELQHQKIDDKTKTETEFKKKVLKGGKVKSTTGKVLGGRASRSKTPVVSTKKPRRKSASASPTVGRRIPNTTIEEENNLFTLLYEEFPYLYLSSDTWHELWRQGIQQIERLTKAQQAVKTRKSRGLDQVEEAESRQKILLNIMRKELAHNERMREQKLKRDQELSVKNKLHEKRTQSARARKYYNEYQVRSRAKMLKRRTKEEMMFKKLFRDGLDIQKERIKEARRYAREQREIQLKERQNDIDSLENYYRDQFEMLAESVSRERHEQKTREKAQTTILDQMKKELRKKMEREIEDFQEQLFRDDDDVYFRELDANRVRGQLRVAKYNVPV